MRLLPERFYRQEARPELLALKNDQQSFESGRHEAYRYYSFSRRFARDPRLSTDERREVNLLFVYVSTPGRGLEVKVLEE